MSNNHFHVSDLGEKKLIKRIINKLDNYESSTGKKFFKHNIGDDAALININNWKNTKNAKRTLNNKDNDERYLVASSDLLIQSKHFPKQMSYFQMGQKAITVNVSDLAAMGSNPIGILISLAVPTDLKLTYFDEIIDGILDICYKYKIPLIGGDTNEADEIIISGTALGIVDTNNTLKKSGFSNGDYIAVTGEIGLASLGFEILKEENYKIIKNELKKGKIDQKIVDLAIEKALNPTAKINEGKILGKFASSATDITDGLNSELHELHESNNQTNKLDNLGLRIYENKLAKMPNFNGIVIISKILNKNPLDIILNIGEDFEILFTSNMDKNKIKNYYKEKYSNKNFDFYIIGDINETNNVEIEYLNGKIEKLTLKGYEHFNRKIND
ncbi:Thiamine-monophosphate kinase [Candidatus Methanobinarius endosymbioticus]|uniref:Thiamine-monophosphate kinase n=1 Tax=Candidatus Methanobinarius endosymbioticus TaxID=2006182 RepID=A0A366MBB2_9EURY|nr:Thiamine-monophosphate kinase [Candidatus Methanobinarius endosymbioticus]